MVGVGKLGRRRSSASLASLLSFLLLSLAFTFALAGVVQEGAEAGVLNGRVRLDGSGIKASSVHLAVKLFGGGTRELGYLRADGGFEMTNLPVGTHLLEVHALGLHFPQYRVDVSEGKNGVRVRVAWAENKRYVLKSPIVLDPVAQVDYFEKPAEMSFGWILKNPMMLMMIVTVLFMVVLPNVMDPEAMKEMQKELKNNPSPMSQLLTGASAPQKQ